MFLTSLSKGLTSNFIYTDGSAFKGENAGFDEPRMQHPDKICEEIFNSSGTNSSNYEAKAIDASLQNYLQTLQKQIYSKERHNCLL